MIVFLNGKYLDAREARIGLFDGGYLYGDGVFETIRLYGGRPFDLEGHLGRLAANLAALDFAWRPEPAAVAAIVAQLVRRNGLAGRDARCRLNVSRGGAPEDPLPLEGLGDLAPTVSAWVEALGGHLPAWQRDGVPVALLREGFRRGNSPGVKSLNYLPTVLALREARRRGCAEALICDERDRLLEGATSNVFVVRDGRLATPPLSRGLLGGRTRALVLEAAARLGLPCAEADVTAADLAGADEVFLCGSVKEIVPVTAVDGAPVGGGAPGPLTRRLQEAYRRGVRDSLGGGAGDPAGPPD